MAALQGIKRRIRTVKSTHQMTKAMQMVAASKLRRAQEAALAPQDYVAAARELLGRLSAGAGVAQLPMYQVRPVRRSLTIVVAGDRGMAGAYNNNILKVLTRHARELGVPQSAICVGRYAALQVAKASDVNEIAAFGIDTGDARVVLAEPILREAMELFESGKVDAVHLVYTKFHSTVRQEATVEQLLPVVPEANGAATPELEPDPDELVAYATWRLLEARVLQAVLAARASEQASRMVAMMNASDNAQDLMSDLTLAYNNARQAAITQELAEISGGAEAINE